MVLTTPEKWQEAIWSAYSFIFWHQSKFSVKIVVDGVPPVDLLTVVAKVLPGAKIESTHAYRNSEKNHKATQEFTERFKYGAKLGLILSLTQEKNIIYSDSDILFFSTSADILNWCSSDRKNSFYVRDPGSDYLAKKIRPIFQAIGADIPESFNSGFFLAPKGSFQKDFVEDTLRASRVSTNGVPFSGTMDGSAYDLGWEYFTEQWIVAAALNQSGGEALPELLFHHSNNGMKALSKDTVDYDQICMRHFYGTVRHRLYTNGMPIALRRMKLRSKKAFS